MLRVAWSRAQISSNGRPAKSIGLRSVGQGVVTPTHKFMRFFDAAGHKTPDSWEALFCDNDVVLYDTERDRDELVNLAHPRYRARYRDLILRLNAALNAALDAEGASDEGGEQKYAGGPAWLSKHAPSGERTTHRLRRASLGS